MELQALSWSHPELRPRVARVNAEWRGVLRDAFERAAREYGLDEEEFPVDALVAMTMTFGQGYAIERLEGIDEGHERAARLDRALARAARSEEERKMSTTTDAPHGRRTRPRRSRAGGAARAEPRPLSRRRGLHRARRRARLLGVLRRGRADGALPADLDPRALAGLEGADPLLRPPLPGRHLRPARQRPLRPAGRARRLRRARVRAGRARRDGRLRGRARGLRRRSPPARSAAAARGRASRSGSSGMVFIGPLFPVSRLRSLRLRARSALR